MQNYSQNPANLCRSWKIGPRKYQFCSFFLLYSFFSHICIMKRYTQIFYIPKHSLTTGDVSFHTSKYIYTYMYMWFLDPMNLLLYMYLCICWWNVGKGNSKSPCILNDVLFLCFLHPYINISIFKFLFSCIHVHIYIHAAIVCD